MANCTSTVYKSDTEVECKCDLEEGHKHDHLQYGEDQYPLMSWNTSVKEGVVLPTIVGLPICGLVLIPEPRSKETIHVCSVPSGYPHEMHMSIVPKKAWAFSPGSFTSFTERVVQSKQ